MKCFRIVFLIAVLAFNTIESFAASKQYWLNEGDIVPGPNNSSAIITYSTEKCVNGYLPTFNDYENDDGGYVAIYSRTIKNRVYSVGGGIYVVGLIRVKGHYIEDTPINPIYEICRYIKSVSFQLFCKNKGFDQRSLDKIFYPTGYKIGDNITQDKSIKEKILKYMPEWKGEDYWIGGNTGGWFNEIN